MRQVRIYAWEIITLVQDQVMVNYIASLRREIREETIEETTERVSKENERASRETVHAMYQDNVPVHKIAGYLRKDTKTNVRFSPT